MQPLYPHLQHQQNPLHEGMKKLATIAMVLAIVHLVTSVAGLVNAFTSASSTMDELKGTGLDTAEFEQALERYAQKAAIYEVIRGVPFIAMSVWLLVLASRLKKFDPRTLETARVWARAAFGVLVFSVVFQVVFVVPEVQRLVEGMNMLIPRGSPEGETIRSTMTLAVQIGTIGGMILNTVVMSIWPIYLLRRSGKLLAMVAARPAIG